jgi:hypothetical protein
MADRIIIEDDFDGAGKYKYAQPSEGAPQPGDLKFKDLNQDGVISDLDRTIIGKSIPDVIIGLSYDCSYKGFDFSLFLYSMLNCDVFNEQRASLSSFNSQDMNHNKLKEYAMNYYREDRPSTEYVRADLNNMNKNDRISTWWVEDASFLRLRDMQLGYTIPVKPSHAVGISRGRIYVSAVNLLTLTGYTGRDPESALAANRNTTQGTSDPLRTGTDFGTYPTPRTFTLGIQVDF